MAFLHGGLDLVVHVDRIGVDIELTTARALVMVAVSLPVLAYAWFVLRRATPAAK